MRASFLQPKILAVVLFVFIALAPMLPNVALVATAQTASSTDPACGALGTCDAPPVQAGADIGSNYSVPKGQWMSEVGHFIGNSVLTVGAMFAWLGGMLLDLAIDNLIVRMAEWIHDGGIGVVINNVWGVIRDISNIVFIFGFVYIGIKMIISPDSGRTKSFLAQLIIAAILINFSLFITKVVIDVSNVFAIEVYKLMATSAENPNIGVAFANEMGLSGFYGTLSGGQLDMVTTGGSITFFVMGAISLIIAGFVFAAGAVMIMIRFVALIFIMIFSPIMFAATVFPQTQGYANKFNSYLFRYAFFAPVFIFLIYVSFRVLKSSTFAGNNNMASLIANPPSQIDAFGVFLHFFMALVFIIFSLVSASKLSLAGGQGVIDIGQKIRGKAQSLIGRTTVGWASNKALEAYDRGEARSKGRFARTARTFTNVATLGLTSDRTVRGTLEGGKKAKFGGAYSFEDDEKYGKDQRSRVADDKARIELERAIKTGDADAIERALNKMSAKQLEKMSAEKLSDPLVMRYMSNSNLEGILKSTEFNEDEKLNFQKVRGEAVERLLMEGAKQNETLVHVIGKATIAQLEDMGIERLTENARGLSNSQMDDIKKSKKFTEIQVGKLGKKRVDDTKTYLNNPTNATAFFSKIKAEDVEKTSKDILMHGPALRAIPISHVMAIRNSKKMDDADKSGILAGWETEKIQQFNADPGSVFQGISDKEKAHLPKAILTDSKSLKYMTKDTLREMLKGAVEANDRKTIKTQIMSNGLYYPNLAEWLSTSQASEF